VQGRDYLRLGVLWLVVDNVQTNPLQAFRPEVKHPRGVVRDVDDTPRDDRPPVIDAHHYRAARCAG